MKNTPFNVLRHVNQFEVAPRDPATLAGIGNSILYALGMTTSSTAILYGVGALGYLGVSVAASWAMTALMSPTMPSGPRSLLVNSADSIAAMQAVYGTVRKGGTITYTEETGNDKYLHMFIALAGHEVSSIGDIYLNDEVVEMDRICDVNYTYKWDGNDEEKTETGTLLNVPWTEAKAARDSSDYADKMALIAKYGGATIGPTRPSFFSMSLTNVSANTNYVIGDQWRGKVRITAHDGSQTQVDSEFFAETENDNILYVDGDPLGTAYTEANCPFVGEGIAYLYVRYEWNSSVFSGGIPLVTAIVNGKEVYDPRTSTTAFSNNAALCVRDYLLSAYGLDDDDANIDDTSFTTAANICDEDVTLAAGGTEKRYTLNGAFDMSQSISDVLNQMMTSCGGTLFWGGGEWKLKVADYAPAAANSSFGLSDLRSGISVQTRVAMRDNFNGVQGTFVDASGDYILTDYPPIISTTFRDTEDNGEEQLLSLDLPFTTSSATAQRLAKLTLFRGREQMLVSADFSLDAMHVEIGDVVELTVAEYGWTAKEFEVIGWEPKLTDGGIVIGMNLRETSEAAFDWDAEEADLIANDTSLPNPYTVVAPTNLTFTDTSVLDADGTHINNVKIKWDASTDPDLEEYEVQWQTIDTTDAEVFRIKRRSFDLSALETGTAIEVGVRAINSIGRASSMLYGTYTPAGDVTAPALPTDVQASGFLRSIMVRWTNPTDTDFKEVQVWRSETDDSATATQIAVATGERHFDSGIGLSETRYYWLKSVDRTGNVSGFTSASVSATTQFINDDRFLASGASDPTPEAEGNIYYNTGGYLKLWDGSSWLTLASTSGLDADTVDGLHASQFLRSDTDDTMAGTLVVDDGLGVNSSAPYSDGSGTDRTIEVESAANGSTARVVVNGATATGNGRMSIYSSSGLFGISDLSPLTTGGKRIEITAGGDFVWYDTADTEGMRWDASANTFDVTGDVGVGSAAPYSDGSGTDRTIEVESAANGSTARVVVNGATATGNGRMSIYSSSGLFGISDLSPLTTGGKRIEITAGGDFVWYDTADTEGMRWDASANTFDVTGTVTADGLTVDGNFSVNDDQAMFYGTAAGSSCIVRSQGTNGYGSFYPVGSGTNASYIFMGNTTSGERVRLTAGNNGQLTVDGNTLNFRRDKIAGAKTSIFVEASGNISFYDQAGTSQNLRWNASSSRLGIGTTNPQTTVHVAGSSVASAAITLDNTGTSGREWRLVSGVTGVANDKFSIYDVDAAATRMSIDASGNVDITSGTISSVGTYNNTTALGANMRVSVAAPYDFARSTSSIKYKTDVEDADAEASAEIVYGARPVWYRSLSEGDPDGWSYWGFIAEELEQLEPRLVDYLPQEDGTLEPEGVFYDRFVVHLVSVAQQQKRRIDDLEARLAALEAKLA